MVDRTFRLDQLRIALVLNYLEQQEQFMKSRMEDKRDDLYTLRVVVEP